MRLRGAATLHKAPGAGAAVDQTVEAAAGFDSDEVLDELDVPDESDDVLEVDGAPDFSAEPLLLEEPAAEPDLLSLRLSVR